jgi:hypothetical protein
VAGAGNVTGVPTNMESRLRHLIPVLLATGCWSPDPTPGPEGDTLGETDTASESATETDPSDPSNPTQPDETDTVDDPTMTGPDPEESSGGETDTMDSADGSSDDTGPDDPTTETGADTMAPSVVSVSPDTAEAGVGSDVSIAITFSEPMDRVSTQAAWQSASIGGVTMSWNGDDTVLTVVPNALLSYASGSDPDDVDALEYAFNVDTTATDKAGNALDAQLTSHFFTLRRIAFDVAPIDALTGLVTTNSINASGIYAGDTQYDIQQVSMYSFALPNLPAGAELTRAGFSSDQTYVGGSPYGVLPGLGEIHLMDVEFDTQFDAPDAVAIADLGILSDDADVETKTLDVTEAVLDDYDADLANTQFRIQFPVATNGNLILDRSTFSKSATALNITYLIE